MNPDNQKLIQELSKTIISRILETPTHLPKAVLEEMSLAALLNILFLLRGNYGSVGDFMNTQRALKYLVGGEEYWSWPERATIPDNGVVN
jgi:hypothetical protein